MSLSLSASHTYSGAASKPRPRSFGPWSHRSRALLLGLGVGRRTLKAAANGVGGRAHLFRAEELSSGRSFFPKMMQAPSPLPTLFPREGLPSRPPCVPHAAAFGCARPHAYGHGHTYPFPHDDRLTLRAVLATFRSVVAIKLASGANGSPSPEFLCAHFGFQSYGVFRAKTC
jgi:hypothetical protein